MQIYSDCCDWLAKRVHGPVPDTGHLSEPQRLKLENALFDRSWTPAMAAFVLGGAVLIPFLFLLVGYVRWLVVVPIAVFALMVAMPIVQVVSYGRERRATIEELRRLGPLPNCPDCGYDLRATPDRCPECGADVGPIAP